MPEIEVAEGLFLCSAQAKEWFKNQLQQFGSVTYLLKWPNHILECAQLTYQINFMSDQTGHLLILRYVTSSLHNVTVHERGGGMIF